MVGLKKLSRIQLREESSLPSMQALGFAISTCLLTAVRSGIMSYCVGAEDALNIQRIIKGRELLGKEFIPYK